MLLQRRQVARSQSPPVAAPTASPARFASFRSAVATPQIGGHTNVTPPARQPCRRLKYYGTDGRSLLSSRPEVACVPLVTTARAIRLLSLILCRLMSSSAVRKSRIDFDAHNECCRHKIIIQLCNAGALERFAIRSFFEEAVIELAETRCVSTCSGT